MNKQNKYNDKSLHSRERQIRNKTQKMEYFQKWRYDEACKYISSTDEVLDVGMGCGSGSYILSKKAKQVTGIDDSEETVRYAQRVWQRENIKYVYGNALEMGDFMFDIIIAFEIIEHIKEYKKFINYIKDLAKKYIIISVPHSNAPIKSRWHWKHFTIEEIKKYFEDENWEIERLDSIEFGNGLNIFAVIKRRK